MLPVCMYRIALEDDHEGNDDKPNYANDCSHYNCSLHSLINREKCIIKQKKAEFDCRDATSENRLVRSQHVTSRRDLPLGTSIP